MTVEFTLDFFEKQLDFTIDKITTDRIVKRAETVHKFETSVSVLNDKVITACTRELIKAERGVFDEARKAYAALDDIANGDVGSAYAERFSKYRSAYGAMSEAYGNFDYQKRMLLENVNKLKPFSDNILEIPYKIKIQKQNDAITECEKQIAYLRGMGERVDNSTVAAVEKLRKNIDVFMKPLSPYFNGTGDVRLEDGSVYSGKFLGGIPDGDGILWYTSGNAIDDGRVRKTYAGGFLSGKPTGEGTIEYTDGARYVGAVLGGARHGYGELSDRNGKFVYRGHWLDNAEFPDDKEKAYYKATEHYGNDYKSALYFFEQASPVFDSDVMIEKCKSHIAAIEETARIECEKAEAARRRAEEERRQVEKKRAMDDLRETTANVFCNIAYLVLFCGLAAAGLWTFLHFELGWYLPAFFFALSAVHISLARYILLEGVRYPWENNEAMYIVFRVISQLAVCGMIVGSLFLFGDITWQKITVTVMCAVIVELLENIIPFSVADGLRETICSVRVIPFLIAVAATAGLPAAVYYGMRAMIVASMWHTLWIVAVSCLGFAFIMLWMFQLMSRGGGVFFMQNFTTVMILAAFAIATAIVITIYGFSVGIFFFVVLLFVICGGIGVVDWFAYGEFM